MKAFFIGWRFCCVVGFILKLLFCVASSYFSLDSLSFSPPSSSYHTSGLWIHALSNSNRRHSHGFSINGFAGLATDQTAQMQGLFAYSCSYLLQAVHFLTNKVCCRKSSERGTVFTVVINYIYVNTDTWHILLFKIKIFWSLVGQYFLPLTEHV